MDNILQLNINIIEKLRNICPEAFKGIYVEGSKLLYNGESLDITRFNINDLFSEGNSFSASLSVFTPDDVFKIIKIHVIASMKRKNSKEQTLISSKELYEKLNSPTPLTEEEQGELDFFYKYYEDLVLYEEYLVPKLKYRLIEFKNYLYELQYGDNAYDNLNKQQEEAIRKANEIESKVYEENQSNKSLDSNKTLEKVYPNNNGSISIIQVLAFIVGVSIILTAITMYLIG